MIEFAVENYDDASTVILSFGLSVVIFCPFVTYTHFMRARIYFVCTFPLQEFGVRVLIGQSVLRGVST